MEKDLTTRFWEKVSGLDNPDGCWTWTACKNPDGYGKIGLEGDTIYAHRLAYLLCIGPIPLYLEVDHLCRNPACVNPSHLELVSHAENVRRGDNWSKGWERDVTHCPQGHEYTPDNLVKQGLSNKRKCKTCHRERARTKHLVLTI